ncbi:MAG: ParA family protein [Pyrinomonadaceae bacterium]
MPQRESKIIAVANQKGGVGKTTITRELAACCALRGYSVLIVDCDPQGSLSTSWVDTEQLCSINLSHVLITPAKSSNNSRPEPLPLTRAIVESPVPNLDIVGSDIKLTNFDREPDDSAYRLRNELYENGANYDLIFLDCPPQLGKLLTAALIAADYVLIVCAASALGLEGLSELAYTIRRVKSNVNRDLETLGTVVNLYMARRHLSRNAREAVEAATDMVGHVFRTNIHNLTEIGEAPTVREPVIIMSPNSKAAQQLTALTDEFLAKLHFPREALTKKSELMVAEAVSSTT